MSYSSAQLVSSLKYWKYEYFKIKESFFNLNSFSIYSNGAGRTGSYILLDLVLSRMNKGAREIDIAATLEHLRDQRAHLVATRNQFEFVLMAVAEEVIDLIMN